MLFFSTVIITTLMFVAAFLLHYHFYNKGKGREGGLIAGGSLCLGIAAYSSIALIVTGVGAAFPICYILPVMMAIMAIISFSVLIIERRNRRNG